MTIYNREQYQRQQAEREARLDNWFFSAMAGMVFILFVFCGAADMGVF